MFPFGFATRLRVDGAAPSAENASRPRACRRAVFPSPSHRLVAIVLQREVTFWSGDPARQRTVACWRVSESAALTRHLSGCDAESADLCRVAPQ